jgi:hypothetical protein
MEQRTGYGGHLSDGLCSHVTMLRLRNVVSGESDFDEDFLAVEGIDDQPADENESERVEQRGEGGVRNYAVNRAIESLLQIDARASVDIVDR